MEELETRQKTTQILRTGSVYVMNIEQALRLARLIMEKSLEDLGVHVERYHPPTVLTRRHCEDGDQTIVFKSVALRPSRFVKEAFILPFMTAALSLRNDSRYPGTLFSSSEEILVFYMVMIHMTPPHE